MMIETGAEQNQMAGMDSFQKTTLSSGHMSK